MATKNKEVYVEPQVTEEDIAKQRQQQEKEYLGPREMAAYIISGIGDKNWETFNGNNEFFYTTTFQHVSPITLSVAQSFCSILDTFDNAISGPILDRTRTRWGRVRPYLVLTLPFWLFSAITPYMLPDGLSQATLLAIFLVIRYIGSISNSFYTPAYQAVLYNLTPNINERNKLIAADTYVDLFGVWLPSLFPFFVDYLPRTIPTRNIYLVGAIIFIALVVVFRVFGFFSLRERVPLASREEMNSTSILKSIKQVASCRPMWALLAKNFFGMGKGTGQSVANYFWLNCTGKLSNAAISGLFTGLPSYFVLPFATKMTKKIGLKKLSVLAYGYCGVVYLIMYLIGYRPTDNNIINLIIIVIGLTLAGAMNSVQRYCGTALQGDLYDYVEWKTGIRNEGMMSAAMGYITLITNNISTILSGIIIAAIKYEPLINSYGVVVPQTDPKMLQAIWTVFTLAPAIGRIGKAISLSFFNVDGKVKEQMMEELAISRAAKLKSRTGNDKAEEQISE